MVSREHCGKKVKHWSVDSTKTYVASTPKGLWKARIMRIDSQTVQLHLIDNEKPGHWFRLADVTFYELV